MACQGCDSDMVHQVARDMLGARPQTRHGIYWRPIDEAAQLRLRAVQDSWIGTAWMDGQRKRGIGTDCKELIVAMLDELGRRTTPTATTPVASAAGAHSDIGWKVLSEIMRGFPNHKVEDNIIEPGDIVVTGSERASSGRIGHVLMAGVDPFTLIHAPYRGKVCYTSFEAIPGPLWVYRSTEKSSWA